MKSVTLFNSITKHLLGFTRDLNAIFLCKSLAFDTSIQWSTHALMWTFSLFMIRHPSSSFANVVRPLEVAAARKINMGRKNVLIFLVRTLLLKLFHTESITMFCVSFFKFFVKAVQCTVKYSKPRLHDFLLLHHSVKLYFVHHFIHISQKFSLTYLISLETFGSPVKFESKSTNNLR